MEWAPITMQDVRLAAGEGKLSSHDTLAAVNAILRARVNRLAAKPADEVRDATIAECAKVALDTAFIARTAVRAAKSRTDRFQALASEKTAQKISKNIKALSTSGQPKP